MSATDIFVLAGITFAAPLAVFGAGVGFYVLFTRRFLNGRSR